MWMEQNKKTNTVNKWADDLTACLKFDLISINKDKNRSEEWYYNPYINNRKLGIVHIGPIRRIGYFIVSTDVFFVCFFPLSLVTICCYWCVVSSMRVPECVYDDDSLSRSAKCPFYFCWVLNDSLAIPNNLSSIYTQRALHRVCFSFHFKTTAIYISFVCGSHSFFCFSPVSLRFIYAFCSTLHMLFFFVLS